MFFTLWRNANESKGSLVRATLDGGNLSTLVDKEIHFPYGVAVDIPNKQIYWIETILDVVERVDYDGRNRRVILKGAPVRTLFVSDEFALAALDAVFLEQLKLLPGDLHRITSPVGIFLLVIVFI